jgi:hypothetical protein
MHISGNVKLQITKPLRRMDTYEEIVVTANPAGTLSRGSCCDAKR